MFSLVELNHQLIMHVPNDFCRINQEIHHNLQSCTSSTNETLVGLKQMRAGIRKRMKRSSFHMTHLHSLIPINSVSQTASVYKLSSMNMSQIGLNGTYKSATLFMFGTPYFSLIRDR